MPDLDGIAVLQLIKARVNSPRVIVVTLHDQDEYRVTAQEAGADGFVAKHEFTIALMPLIHKLFGDSPSTSIAHK